MSLLDYDKKISEEDICCEMQTLNETTQTNTTMHSEYVSKTNFPM